MLFYINDVFDAGIQDNHLSLMYANDSLSKVAIKTPVGLTQREDILKTVNQGEVLSPLKATVSVDSIARDQQENLDEHLYRYQGEVVIPPLGQVLPQLQLTTGGDSFVINSTASFLSMYRECLHVTDTILRSTLDNYRAVVSAVQAHRAKRGMIENTILFDKYQFKVAAVLTHFKIMARKELDNFKICRPLENG